jgi:hypothetical protein
LKDDLDDTDTEALLQIEEMAGLLRLNGGTGTAIQASLTVTDEDAGDIEITVAAVAMAELAPGFNNHYDIQMATGSIIETLTAGMGTIAGDVTRAVG